MTNSNLRISIQTDRRKFNEERKWLQAEEQVHRKACFTI